MIYVCRVDTGSRHIFDFADGIENVGSLANAIERQFKIDKSKQILLISGGEVLDDYQRKFYGFGFGCEESPIYLIDKSNVEKREPPNIETPLDHLNNQDLKQDINAAILLKSSFQTLQHRSQLTYRVNELDKNINKLCQSLYDEQYWQYQGYLALVANLDDYVSSFRKKEQTVKEQFQTYFNNVNSYKDLMKDIDKYVNLLSNVHLVQNLLQEQSLDDTTRTDTTGSNQSINQSINTNCSNLSSTPTNTSNKNTPLKRPNARKTNLFSSISTQSINNLQSNQLILNTNHMNNNNNNNQTNVINENETSTLTNATTTTLNSSTTNKETISLLDWIKSTDPNNKLDTVIDETREILDNFEKTFKWNELESKINKLLNQVENSQQMREIEGLTKRLEDLKMFLDESNKFLANQNEITESLKANFERAASLRDESILHDLCKAHERQLEIFKSNHSNMIEIANKISKAKLELIRVIHSRLHWIMQVQKQIADFDFQVQINFKQLRRLNVRIKLMEQLKKAPYVYVYAMKETLRRLSFSKTYKLFAKLITNLINNIYENEMKQRQLFESKMSSFSQHFVLNILFRSLNDKVEPILNDVKFDFDNKLPVLDEDQVKQVENEIILYLKNDNAPVKFTTNETSSAESSSSSASASTTTSSSSTSCSSTTNLTNKTQQKSQPDNEDFFLKEFKIEIDTNLKLISKTINNHNSNDLNLLSKLVDLLTTDTDECKNKSDLILNEIKKNDQSTQTDHYSEEISITSETATSQTDFPAKSTPLNSELIKETFRSLKLKLNETKEIVNSYQTELNDNIKKINALNDKKLELVENRPMTSTNVKSNLYKKYLELIDKNLKENFELSNSLNDAELNQEDKEFLNALNDKFSQYKLDQEIKINELKQNIEKMKKNFNAESQIKFNEAIKRVVLEKDKIIEDLRNKQSESLELVTRLQKELDLFKTTTQKSNETSDSTNKFCTMASQDLNLMGQSELINNNDLLLSADPNETKSKLREIMLQEKINQLQKQLSMFTTLPVTNNFYETIQLNSCNIDDLVLAVYSEEYCSYKVIHKTSNYLHFVYSAVFKNFEQKLIFRNAFTSSTLSKINSNSQYSSSPNDQTQLEVQFSEQSTSANLPTTTSDALMNNNNQNVTSSILSNDQNLTTSPSTKNSSIVLHSPTLAEINENSDNMFAGERPPQWFIGKVLVKEFCVARKESNRFKVPSGTRFYRVKLKPYNIL